ncbi:hypothetical protein [Mesorhizobium sp. KR1-2]|uniref:hypothetical protein n=1 Tax=Mesorhizobium sp. KR1-2 TaxID=3156609 RepID=UPI0032B3D7D2
MPSLQNISKLMLPALVLLVGVSQAPAIELAGAAYRGPGVGQQRLIDGQVQSLQNEQMRRDYQMQQQFYREQDRPRVSPQQMDVPIYRPGCQNSGC